MMRDKRLMRGIAAGFATFNDIRLRLLQSDMFQGFCHAPHCSYCTGGDRNARIGAKTKLMDTAEIDPAMLTILWRL